MNTYGAQMDRKWTGSVHLSVRTSVHPKHFPCLLDEPYARDLQAQGACALRFFFVSSVFFLMLMPSFVKNMEFFRLSKIDLKDEFLSSKHLLESYENECNPKSHLKRHITFVHWNHNISYSTWVQPWKWKLMVNFERFKGLNLEIALQNNHNS